MGYLTYIVPWSISFVSLVVVILTFIKNIDKDKEADIKEDNHTFNGIEKSLVKVNVKLDQLCNTTTETRTDIKALSNNIVELDKRVCVVERDLKTAFHRIDELRQKGCD